METKVWDNTFTKEDIEVLMARKLDESEWELVVDALYNDDDLYTEMSARVADIALDTVGVE